MCRAVEAHYSVLDPDGLWHRAVGSATTPSCCCLGSPRPSPSPQQLIQQIHKHIKDVTPTPSLLLQVQRQRLLAAAVGAQNHHFHLRHQLHSCSAGGQPDSHVHSRHHAWRPEHQAPGPPLHGPIQQPSLRLCPGTCIHCPSAVNVLSEQRVKSQHEYTCHGPLQEQNLRLCPGAAAPAVTLSSEELSAAHHLAPAPASNSLQDESLEQLSE